jgi:hypothetical protein
LNRAFNEGGAAPGVRIVLTASQKRDLLYDDVSVCAGSGC